MDIRARLEERLTEYVWDTLSIIQTVRAFCEQEQVWTSERREELKKMRDINENQNEQEEEKDKMLGTVLKDTLVGLKKLEIFLEALEKLTVTSSHVFIKEIFLLRGERPETVQSVISDARIDAPVLLQFKRDAETFFQPLIDNVDILINQLVNYVLKTEQLCGRVRRNSVLAADIYNRNRAPLVQLILNVNENAMNQMPDHLEQLCQIRMNQDTRLVFIFQEDAQMFIDVFSKRRSRMSQFLSDLEYTASKLDSMKYGASISNVVGSSVGIAGGVLSIIGLALAPFTAGASLAFTAIGAGLGLTSGANALVTGITEKEVNRYQEQNAQSYLQSYRDDMIMIKECLKEVANCERHLVQHSAVDAMTVGHSVGDIVQGGVGAFEVYAVHKSGKVTEAATKIAMQNLETASDVPQVATYLSKTEQLANAKTLGVVKCSKVASGIANAVFIGLDIYCIVNESISLAQGSKSEAAHLIRSRAALFKSELEAWEKMYNSLCIGITRFSKNKETLEKPFLNWI